MPKSFLCCGGPSKKTKPVKTESLTSFDVASALTPEDRKLVEEISKIVFKEMHLEKKGADFLIMFFQRHPEYQHYFKPLKGIPLEDLKTLPFSNNHGANLISRLDRIIEHLDNQHELKDMIQLVKVHSVRDVRPEDFKIMLDGLVLFIKLELQESFTRNHEIAWRKLMVYVHDLYDKQAAADSQEISDDISESFEISGQ